MAGLATAQAAAAVTPGDVAVAQGLIYALVNATVLVRGGGRSGADCARVRHGTCTVHAARARARVAVPVGIDPARAWWCVVWRLTRRGGAGRV